MTYAPEDVIEGVAATERRLACETGQALNVRWHVRENGARVFIEGIMRPLVTKSGSVSGYLKVGKDVTEKRRADDRIAVMMAELQHRTRNLIAVVQGIANDTMDHTGPTEAFRDAFADRLSALARVQGLLSRAEAEPITIKALVGLELDALGAGVIGDRLVTSGPKVFLKPSTVQMLALALHELATNARKHGALSHDSGHIAVTWRTMVEDGAPRLALDWLETGLEHAAKRPSSKAEGGGYGRELIERALPYALDARTSYVQTTSGVHCTINTPVRPSPIDGAEP